MAHAACRSRISRDRPADRHGAGHLPGRLRRISPPPSPRRSSRRSTASTTCSISARSRPATASCRSPSPSRTARSRCGAGARPEPCGGRAAAPAARSAAARRRDAQGLAGPYDGRALASPDGSFDRNYLSNYATLDAGPSLVPRIDGVATSLLFGARDYSCASGSIRLAPPASISPPRDPLGAAGRRTCRSRPARSASRRAAPGAVAYQVGVDVAGPADDPEQFADIVVRTEPDGRQVTAVRDVARVSSARRTTRSTPTSRRQDPPCHRRVATPRLERARHAGRREVRAEWIRARRSPSPKGLDYTVLSTTRRSSSGQSIDAVVSHAVRGDGPGRARGDPVFLQTWRAAVIPIIAIPVSLIGSCAVMSVVGISINTLSLFGLVLRIGMIVDDAIVVVENVERYMTRGCPARRRRTTMDESAARWSRSPWWCRGLRADRLHHRHARLVLQAVRHHHSGVDGDLGLRVADLVRPRWRRSC